jgi:hypothetical protein
MSGENIILSGNSWSLIKICDPGRDQCAPRIIEFRISDTGLLKIFPSVNNPLLV